MARRTRTARRTEVVIAIAVFSALAACKTATKPADLNPAPGSSAVTSAAAAGSAAASSAASSAAAQESAQASSAAGSSAAAAASLSAPQPATHSAISPVPAVPTPTVTPTPTPSPSSATASASPSTSGSTSSPGQRQGSPKPPVGIKVPNPTATAAPAAAGQELTGKVIVLDPGHNLNNSASINTNVYAGNGVYKACDTTGTSTNGGYPEHAFTWDVANRAATILRTEGATVILTRPNDSSIGPCITVRAQIGNNAHANAFVAIHADGGPAGGHGFFVMQPPPNNPNVNPGGAPQSRILATVMHDTFHVVTGMPYSTYIANGYYPNTTITGTINLSHGPVITIECLNMRNSGDAAIATDPTDRQSIAAGIAAGLTAFLTT
jgi:N-acetylmuramoyl-L-alanine amidase